MGNEQFPSNNPNGLTVEYIAEYCLTLCAETSRSDGFGRGISEADQAAMLGKLKRHTTPE